MNRKLVLLGMALAISPLLVHAGEDKERSVSVAAEMDTPEAIAKFKKAAELTLVCPNKKTDEAKLEDYKKLATHKWSRGDIGCAAQFGYELAVAQPENHELAIGALITQIDYLDMLATEFQSMLYIGPEIGAELTLRWERARSQGQKLIDMMTPALDASNDFWALRSAFWLASTAEVSSMQEKAIAMAKAMPELEALVIEKPDAAGALPLMLMGRVTFGLPEFAGGDPVRAIELLKKGIAINPKDMVMRRWMIEALVSERQKSEAIEAIQAAISEPINMNEPQAYADEMRALQGLALRAGDEKLANQIVSKRQAFLAEHSYLLTRESTAAFGHGGIDPYTGKPID